MSAISVDIDRIVLTDVDVTPDRAERIREMIELELQRLLERQGLSDSMVSREVSYLSTSKLKLAEPQSNIHLANSLARSIAQALRGVG